MSCDDNSGLTGMEESFGSKEPVENEMLCLSIHSREHIVENNNRLL